MFSRCSEVLRERGSQILELQSSNFLKETDERAYTTANVKLTIQSAQIFLTREVEGGG